MSAAPSQALPQDQSEGMSQLVDVEAASDRIVSGSTEPAARGRWLCSQLEAGNILFFSRTPFEIPQDERSFLLGRTQTSSALHKNVAYRPAEDRITGLAKSEEVEAARLCLILKNYSQHAAQFLDELLSPYTGKWKLDFASFRPLEERGRPARLHARNDLPHFDSFPTRPTNGDRILRFFTNLNPSQNRVWTTSQTFEAIGPQFAKSLGLPRPSSGNPLARGLRMLAGALRFPGAHRPPYDNFMHRCHNAMKEDASFRENCPKQRWEFPPGSSWIVFTDCVSDEDLEGQYALEQTFLISRQAMVDPEKSPIAILERIAGYPLSN
jgi:hypothetical protein